MSRNAHIPVSVVTGFLGSGKTTLINALLKSPDMGTAAVIVNEFGEIGLDNLLIESSSEDTILLNSGCLCCTVRGDLVNTLNDLFIRRVKGDVPEFDRVVVETTGLADPAPVLHTLMRDPVLFERYCVDGVITVVDALNGEATLNNHEEAVKQAAVADCLLVSKADLSGDWAALEKRLRALNPSAAILEADHGAVDPKHLFDVGVFDPTIKSPDVIGWLNAAAYDDDHHHHHDVNRHDASIRAFCVTRDEPISGTAFNFLLELLTEQRGEDMLRVKGILYVAEYPDTPAVVHGVQHAFHPIQWLDAWPTAKRQTQMVFITRNMGPESVEPVLDALGAEAARTLE